MAGCDVVVVNCSEPSYWTVDMHWREVCNVTLKCKCSYLCEICCHGSNHEDLPPPM